MSKSKLLFIDDEAPIRKMLGLYLKSKGYEVIMADNGRAGLELCFQELPPIVLTDIKMPDMDGIEVLTRVKEACPETEVIVITGHGDMQMAIESLRLNASDFLLKPVAKEALSVALRRAEDRLETKKKIKMYTLELENKVAEATEELRVRWEFETNLIQHSIDGIIATDEHGVVKLFSAGAENILGFFKDEVVGKVNISQLYPEQSAMQSWHNLYEEQHADRVNDHWVERTFLSKEGRKIPVRVSGTLLYRGEEKIGSVCFFHDLREIKQLQNDLVTSERMAATGQTIAGLAHYIKNILIGLEGGVYIVNKGIRKDDIGKMKFGWDMVQNNIDRVSGVVMDLLNYSREHRPELTLCAPNLICEEVCDLMENKAEQERVRIQRDLDPKLGEIYLDPKGIHRSLLNLVSNAIDACSTDKTESKAHVVTVATENCGDNTIRLVVRDNGCGIDPNTRKELFTSIFSTKGSKGTGLGLLITHKIIREHAGSISVDSQPGQGAAFTISIPMRHSV